MDGGRRSGSPMAGRSIWARVAGGRPANDRVTLGRPVETRVALGRPVQTSHPEGQGYNTLDPPPLVGTYISPTAPPTAPILLGRPILAPGTEP